MREKEVGRQRERGGEGEREGERELTSWLGGSSGWRPVGEEGGQEGQGWPLPELEEVPPL